MENSKPKIRSFTDLEAWKEAHKLVLMIYKETEKFPKTEILGLISQLRRCVVSISSCIAEGFSRQSFKEKLHFYSMSQGSITELQNQILIARDVGFITNGVFQKIAEQSIKVQKLTSGLVKKCKSLIRDT
jgi:four helix bundle protein